VSQQLKQRTKGFSILIIQLAQQLPADIGSKVIQRQIIRSGTSVGANYQAACRAKSTADFINKLKIVEEELDETLYWIEIIQALTTNVDSIIESIYQEGDELLAIMVASIKKARSNQYS